MKCDCRVGDDWDTRQPCSQEARWVYAYALPDLPPDHGVKSYLCDRHVIPFRGFLGTVQPYHETQD